MKVRLFDFRNGERGFSYVALMFAIVIIGLGMTMAARQWKVMVQRELEMDLLSKGIEIQNALALYSATMKAGRVVPGEVYPQSLAELTRLPKPFLRKVYPEPVGHGEWEVIRAPTGGVMGVRSKSKGRPIRQHDFPPAVRHFDGRTSYHDWVFQHPSPSMMLPAGMTGGATVGQGASTAMPPTKNPVAPLPSPVLTPSATSSPGPTS